jgi:hypothetical protein
LIGNDQQTPDQFTRGDDIMTRTTRFVLLAVFLGASLIATGAANRADVTETSGVQAHLAVVAAGYLARMQAESGSAASFAPAAQVTAPQPGAVPYFPAQYELNAAPGSSEPTSTF